MLQVLDAAAVRRWADLSVELLDAHRGELDRINVFPVADADTGTNLAATVRAAAEALYRLAPAAGSSVPVEVAAMALARGALRGARGNSGVIVSQVYRGLAEALAEHDGTGCGRALADGLCRAYELARSAVSRPVEGTVLTVLRAAARHADSGTGLVEVVARALEAATLALADTPRELPELARAGVVDAGGRGLVLLLEALADTVGARPLSRVRVPRSSVPVHARDRSALLGPRETGSSEFDYEVMYLLSDSSAVRVEAMCERLAVLGDSVVVAGDGGGDGDGGMWHVHVHCTDVGAAIEAGITAGRPHRITVIRFADQRPPGEPVDDRFRTARAVVTVVPGEDVAELVRTDGVVALVAPPTRPPSVSRLAAAMTGAGARHLVVLPNDIELNQLAEEAAEVAREAGREIVVVPTSSVLQGLAALAVHDPGRRAGDDVVAMAEAAAATRTGVLQVAAVEALTWAGRCQAGDVLGLVDGEVVLIEQQPAEAGCRLVDRMLTAGGELVTVLLGADGPPGLGAVLENHLRRSHPEVEVVLYRGGPAGAPLQLGVE